MRSHGWQSRRGAGQGCNLSPLRVCVWAGAPRASRGETALTVRTVTFLERSAGDLWDEENRAQRQAEVDQEVTPQSASLRLGSRPASSASYGRIMMRRAGPLCQDF